MDPQQKLQAAFLHVPEAGGGYGMRKLFRLGSITRRTYYYYSSSYVWQLGCWVAIILLGRIYAADAVPLDQYTGTHFAKLRMMTG